MRFVAYLDANSGSMIAAAVASGLAGIAVVFRLFWHRLTGFFSPRRRAEAKAMAAAAETAPSPVEPTAATEAVETAAEASAET